jgi:hypothetical protein
MPWAIVQAAAALGLDAAGIAIFAARTLAPVASLDAVWHHNVRFWGPFGGPFGGPGPLAGVC